MREIVKRGKDRFKRPDGVLTQDVFGELLLLDTSTEVYHLLTGSGLRFWDLLLTGRSRQEILAELATEYDVPLETLAVDLERFTRDLVETGLLELRTPGSGA